MARPDRRLFLLGGLGGLAVLARPVRALGASDAARTLVLLQLSGGQDGLSMLVPWSDDVYAANRRETRISADEVLRLDERVGLHPRLQRLHALFDAGRLALVEGIGYPDPDRSHFRSLDVWHSADPRGRLAGSGWIGRTLERLESPSLHAVVHFGARPPFSLHSRVAAPLCLTPGLLAAADPEGSPTFEATRALEGPGAGESQIAALLSDRWHATRVATAELAAVLEDHRRQGGYPASAIARDLCSAAALIHAEKGVRVCSLELTGFDTHRDQRARHDRLMAQLDAALGAFMEDLQRSQAGRETLVLLFSEFGRRVEENASGGTDHGSGGLALALGAGVRGGLCGRAPDLARLVEGDLAFTTDFRGLYASALERVFGLDPATVLGSSWAGALAFG